jgi:hypothetical protein
MGRTIDTNLRITNMGTSGYDYEVMRSLVRANPLLILDNIMGRNYYPIFDGYKFEEKTTPLMVETSWGMGGGGISPDTFSFLLNEKSNLYLPAMVINGIIGGVSFELAKKVFAFFKKKLPKKRQEIVYYSEKEEITYYEFPSEATEPEFEEGIDEIPKCATQAKPQSHFVRSLKTKTWVEENPN